MNLFTLSSLFCNDTTKIKYEINFTREVHLGNVPKPNDFQRNLIWNYEFELLNKNKVIPSNIILCTGLLKYLNKMLCRTNPLSFEHMNVFDIQHRRKCFWAPSHLHNSLFRYFIVHTAYWWCLKHKFNNNIITDVSHKTCSIHVLSTLRS